MRLEERNGGPHIVLSRRNIEGLLAKLDEPNSARTLDGPVVYGPFSVQAEDDHTHYHDESRGDAVGIAGAMYHPDSDLWLPEVRIP